MMIMSVPVILLKFRRLVHAGERYSVYLNPSTYAMISVKILAIANTSANTFVLASLQGTSRN